MHCPQKSDKFGGSALCEPGFFTSENQGIKKPAIAGGFSIRKGIITFLLF